MKNPTSRGFSLVELLIVIAIIGLLTTVILANSSKGRVKAQASQTLSDFQSIEAALTFMAVDHGIARWWTENGGTPCSVSVYAPTIPGNSPPDDSPGCESNPTIDSLITYSPADGLAKYLSQAPFPPVSSGTYQYDRDSADVFDPDGNNCADTSVNFNEVGYGANIQLWNMQTYPEIFEIIDSAVDGGAESEPRYCGKIRYLKTTGGNGVCTGTPTTDNCNIFYMLSGDGKL
jgi:prepilin-type N-terminal cleavage/methylation domain-containing protein